MSEVCFFLCVFFFNNMFAVCEDVIMCAEFLLRLFPDSLFSFYCAVLFTAYVHSLYLKNFFF